MSSNFREWCEKYSLQGGALIHAGAHFAEERDEYLDLGFDSVYWIEALPETAEICRGILSGYSGHHLIVATLSSQTDQEVEFYLAGAESSSSSILKPHLISASHPEVSVTRKIHLKTTTFDRLLEDNSFHDHKSYGLVIDLQGAEGPALEGAMSLLPKINFLIAEVTTRELYKDGTRFRALNRFLAKQGFVLLASEMNRATGWGEALYINRGGIHAAVLQNQEPSFITKGGFSLGTLLRSALVRAGSPNWVLQKLKRK